jgi:hypothetical protein
MKGFGFQTDFIELQNAFKLGTFVFTCPEESKEDLFSNDVLMGSGSSQSWITRFKKTKKLELQQVFCRIMTNKMLSAPLIHLLFETGLSNSIYGSTSTETDKVKI